VAVSSAVLEAHGLRQAEDIDLIVSPRLYAQLKAQGWIETEPIKGYFVLRKGRIEASTQTYPIAGFTPPPADLVINNAKPRNGVFFSSLEEVLMFKRALGRPKDIADIALIEKYLKKNSILKKTSVLLEMIKFEHTIFALPFALASAVVAVRGIPALDKLIWIVLCMVGARSAAMGFNRIADRKIDAKNPRTKDRAIPAHLVSLGEAWTLVILSSLLFVVAAAMANLLVLVLAPLALVLILGYSYSKRFTAASHFILGACLALAPIGAWVALRGNIALAPVILGMAVMLWTGGFDILYSLQDVGFDKKEKLFSIPSRLGERTALWISRLSHLLAAGLFVLFGVLCGMGNLYYIGVGLSALSLVYEHLLVHPGRYAKINSAFFTMNGIVSIVFFIFTLADILFLNTLHD